jgi:hypothetical protein
MKPKKGSEVETAIKDQELNTYELDKVTGGHHHRHEHPGTSAATSTSKPAIANSADDLPLNYLGLFNSAG